MEVLKIKKIYDAYYGSITFLAPIEPISGAWVQFGWRCSVYHCDMISCNRNLLHAV